MGTGSVNRYTVDAELLDFGKVTKGTGQRKVDFLIKIT